MNLYRATAPNQTQRVARGLRLNLWLILFLSTFAFADQWTFFHADTVTALSCKVEIVDQQFNGHPERREIYQAEASAVRNDKSLGNWRATIGQFPLTIKGRHQAEKACSKWMDEATKRVRAAK